MSLLISSLATGLNLLTFQGITSDEKNIFVTTIEADILKIALDGSITPWVNLSRYGIPTGITKLNQMIIVVLSAQETGHYLLQVSPSGKIDIIADLSDLVGEFGSPFGITARNSYYPYYFIAISTDVVSSNGLVARVTTTGKVSIVAKLPVTPFDIVHIDDHLIVTREDGYLSIINLDGKVTDWVDLKGQNFGNPFGITAVDERIFVTTTTGFVLTVTPDGSIVPLVNIAEIGWGFPTSVTTVEDRAIVATSTGTILAITIN